VIDLATTILTPTASAMNAYQSHSRSTGAGLLDLSRGLHRVGDEGVELAGEQDIMGTVFDTAAHAALAAQGASWSNGEWSGAS
jgi:hypothetical protein